MLEAIRKFLQTRAGAATAGILVVVALLVAFFVLKSSFTSEAEELAANRTYIDATTNKPFHVRLEAGMELPIKAPSGGKTGYPAEMCYWTKDGKLRKEPYAVLLNSWVGKAEPTFCPDCGRLVRPHNPVPAPGDRPPPTAAEFKSR